jgi:hypothetical protein
LTNDQFQKHQPHLAEHIRLHCSSPDDALLEARRFQSVMRSDWMDVNIKKLSQISSVIFDVP